MINRYLKYKISRMLHEMTFRATINTISSINCIIRHQPNFSVWCDQLRRWVRIDFFTERVECHYIRNKKYKVKTLYAVYEGWLITSNDVTRGWEFINGKMINH